AGRFVRKGRHRRSGGKDWGRGSVSGCPRHPPASRRKANGAFNFPQRDLLTARERPYLAVHSFPVLFFLIPVLFRACLDAQAASSKRPLLHHREENRNQNQNVNSLRNHAADNRRSEGFHDIRTDSPVPETSE